MVVLAFQRKWIDASQQKQRSACLTHDNDLCDFHNILKSLDADLTGAAHSFKKGSGCSAES